MTVREVIRMGHPHLRIPAADYPTDQIATAQFKTLINDMRETLHAHGGIGLAAPQIDVGFRLAVIEIEQSSTRYGEVERLPFSVFINPGITLLSPEEAGYWEGCLSIPGLRGYVERPQHIRVDYIDDQGHAAGLEAHGFLASVFQHEFDHLDGTLYIDRIKDPALLAYEQEWQEHWSTQADSGEAHDAG